VWLSPERLRDLFGSALATAKPGFDIAAFAVPVVLTDDLQAGRDSVKPQLALYIGGMGAKKQNFYNALVGRYGYEGEAAEIQGLYLDGKKREAIAAVPDALVDEVALVGPPERIADRLGAWRESGVTTLLVQTHDRETLRTMAELLL
jgi:alkanesulfonate monooxygenase SsuD/methylene tetrahydromethanopterin reductase-like flavin-dependent oxidoreductase (luciferase family)